MFLLGSRVKIRVLSHVMDAWILEEHVPETFKSVPVQVEFISYPNTQDLGPSGDPRASLKELLPGHRGPTQAPHAQLSAQNRGASLPAPQDL